MIRQLILELIEKGEPQAAKGLAIAYLKHEDDPEVANSLATVSYTHLTLPTTPYV